MTRSEWICNICGEDFETRGRRDGHRQWAHRQKVTIGIDKQGVRRSESGKFECKCGRDYILTQSLQRHRRNCKDDILSNEIENNYEEIEEGAYQ